MGDIKELRSVGAIVSDGTWEILRRAEGQSARLPGPPRSESLRRVQPGDDIPAEIEALVVDLHAYKNLVTLATSYRLFMRKVLFVAATPEEELGLLEFIDPSDDIVRADALESQLAIRIERLVSAPHATRMDALTGLSNRRFITDVAKRAIREGVDAERPLSLIMVDLDHFKSINDRFGHAAGDTVLKATGQALASSAAGALCVARIGGEEFLLLLRADRELARARAEAIRSAIEALVVEPDLRFTASLGVATATSVPCDFDGLLGAAETCLYHAKQSGRNLVVDQAEFGRHAASRDEDPAILDFDNHVRALTDRLAGYLSQKGRVLARGFQDEAELDGLTGIFNRRYFDRRVPRELDLARKPDRPLCLLLFDLDDFGAVNRDYGYPAGDRALKAATAVIARSVRATDWVARYGGEELCAVLPDTVLEEGATIAERILEELRNIVVAAVDGREFGLTASCGIVETRGQDAGVPEFVQRASDKVREAKKSGKDRAAR